MIKKKTIAIREVASLALPLVQPNSIIYNVMKNKPSFLSPGENTTRF